MSDETLQRMARAMVRRLHWFVTPAGEVRTMTLDEYCALSADEADELTPRLDQASAEALAARRRCAS